METKSRWANITRSVTALQARTLFLVRRAVVGSSFQYARSCAQDSLSGAARQTPLPHGPWSALESYA